MKKIFYKYVYLNGKNILLGILSSLLFGAIAFDDNSYYPVAILMGPSLIFTFVVGKMCYEEDNKSTKEFLLALPILKKDIALEKNIVGQICLVSGFLIITTMFYIINIIKGTNFIINIETALIILGLLIIYNTIYIYLNYKFNYSKTQYSSYIILILMFALFKFRNEFISLMGNLNSYLLLIGVILLSFTSLFITKKSKWSV